MKTRAQRSWHWGLGMVGFLLALFLALFGVRQALRMSGTQTAQSEAAALTAPPARTQDVLWQAPNFEFLDQHGRKTTQLDLKGHVWIADFIYTTCTSACPTLTAKMVNLQRKLTNAKLRFVSFSVDPAHDTPSALAQYQRQWRPDETRWTLLSTTERGLRAVTQAMHVAVQATGDERNPILHATLFFLVGQSGEVRGIYDSADPQALERLVADASTLLGSTALPAKPTSTSGQALYQALSCEACHGNTRIAPPLQGLMGKTVTLQDGRKINADRVYLRESLISPGARVVAGYSDLMPSYEGQLSSEEMQALDDYVASLAASNDERQGGPPDASFDQSSNPQAVTMPQPAQPSGSGARAAVEVPDLRVDPVCKMNIHVAPGTPEVDYEGHSYFFCSDGCRDKFVSDPQRYATKSR